MKFIHMSKNKIAVKLSVSFFIALLFFSIIMGGFFLIIFSQHTIQIYKDQLEEHATSISSTLADYMGKNESRHGMEGMGGYGAYLRFIYDIAGTDVWIIDRDYSIVTSGRYKVENSCQIVYEDLPDEVKPLIDKVFEGETTWCKGFSEVLSGMKLTVGTPIKGKSGEILGIVLLHSSMDRINEGIKAGIKVLSISIVIGIVIVAFMAIGFSILFTRPLKKMKNIALQLSQGNYKIKQTIEQNDEIGELAHTLEILARQLEIAKGEQERLEKLRNDFIANISHELKTPITVIRGSLEALVDGVITDSRQVAAYHDQMLFETIFLQRLVNDLLDLSKLQNTDFIIEMHPISLCELLSDVIRSASQLAKNKEIIFEVNNQQENCIVNGDYGRIRQMLMIILDNAIKFSNPQGVVEIGLFNKCLVIQDNGIGISKEELPHVFEKFYKSRSETNKTGTGLGLAIAYQIAKRHHIKIEVEGEEGVGTRFMIDFNEK